MNLISYLTIRIPRSEWHGNNEFTYGTLCESCAYFMQYLAELAAASGRGIEIFGSGVTTAVIPVYFGGKFGIASKYSPQFSAFIGYGSYIEAAHLQLSYYLLA